MDDVRYFVKVVSEAAKEIKGSETTSEPEKILRQRIEAVLPTLFSSWGLEFEPDMERTTVTKRRIDMLCGRVVTEYKAPGILASQKEYGKAIGQARNYIEELAQEFAEPLEAYYGIVVDGFHIGFLHYDPLDGWIYSDRLQFDESSAIRLLERYRAHSKHPLDAAKMADAFGPESEVARAVMKPLVEALAVPSGKTDLLLSEWQRLFGQAVGTEAHQYPGIVDWAELLGVKLDVNDSKAVPKFFFATHTYYAIVIKLMTLDIVGTARSQQLLLHAQQLAEAPMRERKEMLQKLEDNTIFRDYGITNFLEGGFFSWYLDAYNDGIDSGIAALARSLQQFEPATPLLSPAHVTDLFKRLYQYLVPAKIRHDLGEFYTPDWLADYVLLRSGFADNPTARLLDPTCGSGTFLVRAIRMIRDASPLSNSVTKELELEDIDDSGSVGTAKSSGGKVNLIDHIRNKNLVGLDLNPLAVISARANIVLSLIEEIAGSIEPIELPIYLADSIYVPTKKNGNYVYRLETEKEIMEMRFPDRLVESDHFNAVMREIEEHMREDNDKPAPDDLPKDSLIVTNGLRGFYEKIWTLDEQDWNKIWCRIVYNRFASAILGSFDYVIGNPPWVLWSNLPASYRRAVKPVCEHYDIFSEDAWVGGIESDISTVIVYAAADRWLKESGVLAFVITQSVFKTKSAQGFRRFTITNSDLPLFADREVPLCVLQVDDLVSIKPFEDAQNRTAVLFLRKGEKTGYPVPYMVWQRRSPRDSISTADSLSHVMRRVQIWPYQAAPAGETGKPWITAPTGHLQDLMSLLGGKGLEARKGTTSDFNNIYWVRPLKRSGNLVLVDNNHSARGHQVERRQVWIEEEILYPLARGVDISRFSVEEPEFAIILPQKGMRAFPEDAMTEKYANALEYFKDYRDSACIGCSVGGSCRRSLETRSCYLRYGSAIGEYWAVWNVGSYTFSPYKVAWREISSKFEAAVLSMARLDHLDEKAHIPDHKLMIYPCDGEDEAHFYCGILNSELVRMFAESVALSTGHGTRIFEDLKIPSYDPSDNAHRQVANLSKAAHRDGGILNEEFEHELDLAVSNALGHLAKRSSVTVQFDWSDPLIDKVRSRVERVDLGDLPEYDQVLNDTTFVAIDIETSGFSPSRYAHRIVEIGAVRFNLSGIEDSWGSSVWPSCPIDYRAQEIHGIRLDDLMNSPTYSEIVDFLLEFVRDSVVVMHNADFDWSFLHLQTSEAGRNWAPLIIDTLRLLRYHFDLPSNKLKDALAALGAEGEAKHAALPDANATAHLFLRIVERLRDRTCLESLQDLISIRASFSPRLTPLPEIPPNILTLIQNRERVRVEYVKGDKHKTFEGSLLAAAVGELRSYYTLQSSKGSRLILNFDNVAEISRCK